MLFYVPFRNRKVESVLLNFIRTCTVLICTFTKKTEILFCFSSSRFICNNSRKMSGLIKVSVLFSACVYYIKLHMFLFIWFCFCFCFCFCFFVFVFLLLFLSTLSSQSQVQENRCVKTSLVDFLSCDTFQRCNKQLHNFIILKHFKDLTISSFSFTKARKKQRFCFSSLFLNQGSIETWVFTWEYKWFYIFLYYFKFVW